MLLNYAKSDYFKKNKDNKTTISMEKKRTITIDNCTYYNENENLKCAIGIGCELKYIKDHLRRKKLVIRPWQVFLILYYNTTNYWVLDDNFIVTSLVFDNCQLAMDEITKLKLSEEHNKYLVNYRILSFSDLEKTKVKVIVTTDDYYNL